MTDIRQSKNYAKYMESLDWMVEKIGATNVFVRHLPTLSFLSVIKVQRFAKIDFKKLDSVVKKHHSFLTKIEPLGELGSEFKTAGFKKDDWPLSPTKTLILDLNSISLDSFPKDTRYEIRKALSNNLAIRLFSNIDIFYKLLQETMKIGHWSVPIKKEVTTLWTAFQPKSSQILFAYVPQDPLPREALAKRGQSPQSPLFPVAGCLLIWDQNTAHYMYAALTQSGRELGAAYFTLWEAIKFCQKKGLKYLDLEGVYDERFAKQTKNWQGFTKFKMGWGGKVKEYLGSWTRYSFPFTRITF